MSGNDDRTRTATVREYYRALDTHDYDLLAELLSSEFVHYRPDMTLDGRERFVRFMRAERPLSETSHPIDGVYRQEHGDEVVVRGRLLDSDDAVITRFVDVFSFANGKIAAVRTFTD